MNLFSYRFAKNEKTSWKMVSSNGWEASYIYNKKKDLLSAIGLETLRKWITMLRIVRHSSMTSTRRLQSLLFLLLLSLSALSWYLQVCGVSIIVPFAQKFDYNFANKLNTSFAKCVAFLEVMHAYSIYKHGNAPNKHPPRICAHPRQTIFK